MVPTLPVEVMDTLREFRVCELSTVARDGTPVTWPVSTRYFPDRGRFLLTTSISLRAKAVNIGLDPRVGMLFSDPTGSGLPDPHWVLVKGRATVLEGLHTGTGSVEGLEEYWRESVFRRQPRSAGYSSSPLMRRLMDWYYIRHVIEVEPVQFSWWPSGDMSRAPERLEVESVD